VNTSLGRAAFAALIAFGAAHAHAQITTVVSTPPKRNEQAQQVAAQREQAAQDSVARVTLTGMKEWVDSAATALAIRPDTGTKPADTAVTAPARAMPAARDTGTATRRESAPEFRDGSRAPNTATLVPTIAVAGVALLALGIALRRRPRAARERARR
jgi:hypothetical protein